MTDLLCRHWGGIRIYHCGPPSCRNVLVQRLKWVCLRLCLDCLNHLQMIRQVPPNDGHRFTKHGDHQAVCSNKVTVDKTCWSQTWLVAKFHTRLLAALFPNDASVSLLKLSKLFAIVIILEGYITQATLLRLALSVPGWECRATLVHMPASRSCRSVNAACLSEY